MTTLHAYRASSHGLRFPFARMVSVLVTVTMIVTAFLTSYRVANAQEAEASLDAEAGVSTAAAAISEEVLKDFQVTQQDLGAIDATILPDSPLHFFKEVGWALGEAFTFDPVADAELKLEHANQELYEIHLLAQTESVADAEVAGDIVDATQRIAGRMEEIADAADSLQLAAATDPAVQQLIAETVEHQVNQEKVLEVVEEQVEAVADAGVVVDLQEAREDSVAGVAVVLVEAVEEPEAIVEMVDQVFDTEGADGSAFVELKNLEIVEKFEDAVVANTTGAVEEAMVAAMEEVQEGAVLRFEEDLQALSEEDRAEQLVEYIEFVPGDEAHLFSACDSLKDYALPEDVLVKIEEMKDVVATRVSAEFEESDDPEIRAAFFERFTDAQDFGDVRILDEITDRVAIDDADIKAEMEAYRDEGIKQFTERFTDALSSGQAEQFRALSVQMAGKPDPTTMKLMMELEGEVRSDPNKAAFLNEMQGLGQKMRTVFEEKFDRYGDYFMKQTATSDPRDLQIMEQFAKQYQPSANLDLAAEFGDQVFEVKGATNQSFLAFGAPSGTSDPFAAFQSEQKSFITEHVQGIDNPEVFRAMQERFLAAAPDVVQEMQSFGNFKEVFNQKASFIQDKVLAQEAANLQVELQQQSASELLNQLSGVTDETVRQQILQQAQTQQATQLEEQLKARQDSVKQFSSFNPFCDAACQQTSSQRLERKFEQQTTQLKQDVHGDVTKQFEQFKALEQSGGLEQYKAQFEKQLGAPSGFERGGIFPGQGATEGAFPGRGATEGAFPGQGEGVLGESKPKPFESTTGAEVKSTPTPKPAGSIYPRPVQEFKSDEAGAYPKTGETGYHQPTADEMKKYETQQPTDAGTYTYPKPGESTGSFDDFFKTYQQPKAGETTTQPKPGETGTYTMPDGTTYQPKPGDTTMMPKPGETTTYPKPGETTTYQQPSTGTQQPSTGTTQPSTGATQPYSGTQPYNGTQQPSTGTTQPTSGGTTYTQPTHDSGSTYTPPPSNGGSTYTPPPSDSGSSHTPPSGGTTYTPPPSDSGMMSPPPGGSTPPPGGMAPPPGASLWQRLARGLYAFLTFPARAFGL